MSRRQRYWEYRVRHAELGCSLDEAMDRVIKAVEAVCVPANYGCGYGAASSPTIEYLLLANKAKARRLAGRLDARLGVRGVLVEFDPREGE